MQGTSTSTGALASICGLIVGGAAYSSLGSHLFFVAAALFAGVLLATRRLFRAGGR